MKFYFYDSTVYRQAGEGDHFDRWLEGEWQPARGEAAPTEEEYSRMREIGEQDAARLRG